MSVTWTDWNVVPRGWTTTGVETGIPAAEGEGEAGDRVVTCFVECRTPGDTGGNRPVFVVDDIAMANGE